VSDWTFTLPGLVVDALPVRFLPLASHVTVPFRPTVAPSGIGIVFQSLIKLPISASYIKSRQKIA
jgi:hypothetical protein